MFKKILTGLLALVVIAAVGLWLWWPANYVVKGPMFDFLTGKQVEAPDTNTLNNRFKLPDGFNVGIFATNVPHARMMRITETGDLVVTSMRGGDVILLHRDDDGDGVSDGHTLLMSGLDIPSGLALNDGYLYVAETGRIIRAPFDAAARTVGASEVVFDRLPPGGNHRTRTIGFGPDGLLYVTVGSTCNVCEEENPFRAAMLKLHFDPDTGQFSDPDIYANGLRNTVGFDWQPGTGKLYGTDNGRDLLGDDTPHCELNLIEEGGFYGWPYAYDNKVPDPDYGAGHEMQIENSFGPVHGFGAHRAPLGMHFLVPGLEPEGYEGAALVALHGSWNRSTLAGYKVVSLHFGDDGGIEERDFLTGFEKDEDVIGRPVDVVQGPDGAIYVSDDYAGLIYRVTWGELKAGGATLNTAAKTNPLAGWAADDITSFAQAGQQLFEEYGCASCHDPAEAPEGVQVKILKDLGARYDVAGIQALLKAPPGPMPVFDLTDDEQKALAVYLLSRETTPTP